MSEMEAGRELDALVAEKVMGWKVHHRNTAHYVLRGMREYKVEAEVSGWRPSTDIAAAWQVVEKVAPMFRRFEIHAVDGSYVAQIEGGTCDVDCNYIADATADTAPLAICRAALAALEATCAK